MAYLPQQTLSEPISSISPPSLTLQEKLDRLPRDRHVRLFRLSGSPEWYATWSVVARPVTTCLGQDECGLIAELIKQWTISKPITSQQENGLEACLEGHTTYSLLCGYCITRAAANIARKRRSA